MKVKALRSLLSYGDYYKMPDFRKTRSVFEEQGLEEFWKKIQPPPLLDDELFEKKVMNPDTNDYYQVADLLIEYRKFGEDKKYPIREVLQIKRIKRVDGTEWRGKDCSTR